MFEDMTPEKIRKRILARLETNLQTREGSFTNDIIAAAAAELSECYHSLDALVPAFYVDETSGPYIDKQAATVGIFRKAGTEAECTLLLAGAEGAQVPAGTPFYTAADGFLERGRLTSSIIAAVSKQDKAHETRWAKLWADTTACRYRRGDHVNFWVWSHGFFDAPIEDLRHIENSVIQLPLC